MYTDSLWNNELWEFIIPYFPYIFSAKGVTLINKTRLYHSTLWSDREIQAIKTRCQ